MAEVGRAISLGLAPGGASIWDSSAPNDFDGEVQYATARLNKFVKEALASSALQKGNVQEFSVNTNGCGLLDPKLWNIAAPLLVACAPHLLRLTLQWIPDIEQLPMFPQLQALIIKHDETSAFYEWLHPQFNETKFAPNPKLRNECWKSLASRFPRLIELELPYEDDLAMVVHFPHLHCFRGHWLRISRDSLHHLLPHKNLDILGLINVSRDDDAHDEKVLQQNLDVICELLSRNTLIRLELETDTIGGCKLFCSNGLERILSGIGSSICLASLTLDLREDYHLHAKGLIRALETNSGLSEISLTLGSSKHPALIEALCCHRSLTYLTLFNFFMDAHSVQQLLAAPNLSSLNLYGKFEDTFPLEALQRTDLFKFTFRMGRPFEKEKASQDLLSTLRQQHQRSLCRVDISCTQLTEECIKELLSANRILRRSWLRATMLVSFYRTNRHHSFRDSVFPLLRIVTDLLGHPRSNDDFKRDCALMQTQWARAHHSFLSSSSSSSSLKRKHAIC